MNIKSKFICTHDEAIKKKLENLGCRLLYKKDNGVWLFINELSEMPFSFEENKHIILTDTLNF